MLLIQIPTIDNIDELKNKIEEVSNELINIEFEFLILDHSKLNYSENLNLFRKKNKFNKINYYHLEKKSKKNERGLASRFGYEKAIELHEDVDLIEIDSDTFILLLSAITQILYLSIITFLHCKLLLYK